MYSNAKMQCFSFFGYLYIVMKILYRYILKSFVGPLALTLVIALFTLLMQFLWKYIDDLVGKGLSWYVIFKLMGLATVTLIPMALPLAILLASIMTFGNLAENHELVSMKSAGFSLPKIMSSLIVFIFFVSLGAFFFANNVLPYVNLKMGSLLYDIRTAKPALNIQQDVFYNGIDGYSLRIAEKDKDNETLHNIMVYDHTSNEGNIAVILAKSGKIKMSADKHYMVMDLNNGNSYQEILDNQQQHDSRPLLINNFAKQTIYFDLSSFKFSRTNEDLFKHNYEMMDMKQLSSSTDSVKAMLDKTRKNFYSQLDQNYFGYSRYMSHFGNNARNTPAQNRASLLDVATTIARNAKLYTETSGQEFKDMEENITRRTIEWHRKITFSVACFILFFIGAPLGAIIKKGGLGMPVVVSALFFILFYIMSITGEKFAREGVLSVIQGMWGPSCILFPIGIFFTYKASMDSGLFDKDAYIKAWNRLIRPFKSA